MKNHVEACDVSLVKIGGVKVSRIIVGCLPFLGESYQGPERNGEYAKRFVEIENTVRILSKAVEKYGITAVAAVPEMEGRLAALLLRALKETVRRTSVEIGLTPCLRIPLRMEDGLIDDYRRWLSYFEYERKIAGEEILDRYLNDSILLCREGWQQRFGYALKNSRGYSQEEMASLEVDFEKVTLALKSFEGFNVLFVEPGSETDFLAIAGRTDLLDRLVRLLKKSGFKSVVLGIHHAGSTIPLLEETGIEFDGYLTPVNKKGALMLPTRNLVVKAIRDAMKPVIAIKTMAGGRIPPREALEYVFGEVGVEACMVGVGSEKEADEDFSIATEVVKKFFP